MNHELWKTNYNIVHVTIFYYTVLLHIAHVVRCWLHTLECQNRCQLTSYGVYDGQIDAGELSSFLSFTMLIIISPLFSNHLSLPPDVYDSPDKGALYNILCF